MPPGLAYVMMSRSSSLDDLFIKGKFNEKNIKCDQNALKESQRLDEISLTKPTNQPDQPCFSIAFLNIRSLKKHFEDLKINEALMKCDLIFLTETWMAKNDHVELPNHSAYSANFGKGKGVCAFSKENVKARSYVSPSFQVMSIEHQNGLQCFCVYLSKDCSYKKVKGVLISLGLTSHSQTCLFGDFNYDVGKKNELSDFIGEEFVNKITRATHDDGHIIDHFYAPPILSSKFKITIQPVYHSDHDLILCKTTV